MDPASTKLHLKVSEIVKRQSKNSVATETKLFYSISDGADQYFNSVQESPTQKELYMRKQQLGAKEAALKAVQPRDSNYIFNEKFTFKLSSGFDEFTLKVYSLTHEEALEETFVLKAAEELVGLVD